MVELQLPLMFQPESKTRKWVLKTKEKIQDGGVGETVVCNFGMCLHELHHPGHLVCLQLHHPW